MLMEQLFSRGIMQMGPSRVDPQRQAGVFNPTFVGRPAALRAAEMEKFRWMAGEWDYENKVPATRVSPAYTDSGSARFSFNEKTNWISMVAPDGQETPNITLDPFEQAMDLPADQGFLRNFAVPGMENDTIAFTGMMTMIGINTDWRLTLTREGNDAFSFVNEERRDDGSWAYFDEWRFVRRI